MKNKAIPVLEHHVAEGQGDMEMHCSLLPQFLVSVLWMCVNCFSRRYLAKSPIRNNHRGYDIESMVATSTDIQTVQ
jgi:hypothetical protein